MAFTLEKVVPWGRSFEEYLAMFDLSEEELGKRFLGCGDGPASFNCMMKRRGRHVISTDPIYRFTTDEIKNRIKELSRVASEARIFPLLELGAKKSRHLDRVIDRLEKSGFSVDIRKVAYEFQKGGNEMLTVSAP